MEAQKNDSELLELMNGLVESNLKLKTVHFPEYGDLVCDEIEGRIRPFVPLPFR